MSNTVLITTKFATYTTIPKYGQYSNGRTAISFYDALTDEPICTATVNIPQIELADDEVAIKNYSENEGILTSMVMANMIIPTDRAVRTGFVICPICKLTSDVLAEVNKLKEVNNNFDR